MYSYLSIVSSFINETERKNVKSKFQKIKINLKEMHVDLWTRTWQEFAFSCVWGSIDLRL